MKSPFPGMDPYIEQCGLWDGFHNRLIYKIDETLAQILPQGYIIDTAVRSYIVLIETRGKTERLVKPDVAVIKGAERKKPGKRKGGGAATETRAPAESLPMRAFIAEKFEEMFVEIYAQREERILVTCIELLSPSNKRPNTEGWQEYKRKRQALLLGRANFVELDLLRGGDKMPMLDPWPDSPYTVLVCRQDRAPYCRVWPAHFRHRLPVIPVPLLDPDPDLTLDLQPLVDQIYALGRYDEQIDYTQPLTPALSNPDAAWLREQLQRRQGGRVRKRSP
jgi:hypothetical protein